MRLMRCWMILFVAIFSISCLVQAVETPVSVTEIPVEKPFIEPTGTPDCQPSTEVSFEVERIGPLVCMPAGYSREKFRGSFIALRLGATDCLVMRANSYTVQMSKANFRSTWVGSNSDKAPREIQLPPPGTFASSMRAASPVRQLLYLRNNWLLSSR